MAISARLADASCAMLEAQNRAADLWHFLVVLSMAIGSESRGIDADQRSGIEHIIGKAADAARENLEAVSTANSAIKQLLEAHT